MGVRVSRRDSGTCAFHAVASGSFSGIQSAIGFLKKFFHRQAAPVLAEQEPHAHAYWNRTAGRPKRIARKFVARPYDCSFLFYGPPGVGKTSMAQAMAEEINAELHHVGSQKLTLDELERICRICAYVPMEGKGFHFVLIDEVDSASRAAQLALLSRLDSTEAPQRTV